MAPIWSSAANAMTLSLAASDEYSVESGALGVHAFDQPETLLGQGTVGLEFEQQRPTSTPSWLRLAAAGSSAASLPGMPAGSS